METYKTKIAIAVLNWNGKTWLEKFLPALVEHSNEASIFVIDNNSSDDSVMFLTNNYPNVSIIRNGNNGGYAKGYNDGLNKINAQYFILVNSDIEVTKGWIDPIISLMDSDPKIAACQPKILDYNNKNKFEYAGASGGFIDFLGYPFCRGRIFQHIEKDTGQYDNVEEIFWATGACIFIRSRSYLEVNGFDKDFFAHQEEIDLCWRLKNLGYKIMVQPKSIVFHVGGATLEVGSPFKTYLNFRNNLYMLFKNLPFFYLPFIFLIRLFLDGLAAVTFITNINGIQHFLSIIKAHFVFYFNLPNLINKRMKISQKFNLIGRKKYSLIFMNKIRGITTFSKLK